MCYTQICPRFECQDEHTIDTCVYRVLTLNARTGRGVCMCVRWNTRRLSSEVYIIPSINLPLPLALCSKKHSLSCVLSVAVNEPTLALSSIGLLHLKFPPPLWKILEQCTKGGCEISNAPTFCVSFRLGLSQREWIFYFEVPNELIFLEFKLPLCKMFLKSSTGGVEFKYSCPFMFFSSWQSIFISIVWCTSPVNFSS